MHIGNYPTPRFIKKSGIQNAQTRYFCWYECFCGNCFLALPQGVKSLNNKSCGCLNVSSLNRRKHGHSLKAAEVSLTYRSWSMMKNRCLNSSATGFEHYGGKGITIDDRWHSFQLFLEDMGERPGVDYCLSRIDHDLSYTKDNVRWETKSENCRESALRNKPLDRRLSYT